MNVQTDDTLQMRYDATSQSLIITTPKGLSIALNDSEGLSIALNDSDGSITLKDTHANTISMGEKGIELCGNKIDIHANMALSLRATGTLTINGAMVMIN